MTFRVLFLGLGLSAFSSVSYLKGLKVHSTQWGLKVLGTIYTFKPQNATVSQLFCLIIAYVLGMGLSCEKWGSPCLSFSAKTSLMP